MNNPSGPDLTLHPPRSPRIRLGGYVLLPRMLDKCQASLAGTNGEYNYNCPMDQHFLSFAGIEPDALQAEAATGKGDSELLAWITAHAANHPAPSAIAAWSAFMENRAPCDVESREFFQEEHHRLAPLREDVSTWFDLLDLDDYLSFGGRA